MPWQVGDEIRLELKKEAQQACGAYYKELAECTKDKLFSVLWKCKDQRAAVRECIEKIMTLEEIERRKWLWKQEFDQQQREREQSLLAEAKQEKEKKNKNTS